MANTSYEFVDCPACGAGDARELADRMAIREQVEELWRFHLRRLRPGAPLHELADRLVFSQRPPVRVVACRGCGTVYRDPRERERTILELYAEERPDPDTLRSLFESQRAVYRAAAARLTRLAGGPGRGLEIGSYVGAFLAAAADEGWEFGGLDVSAAANRFARDQGFRIHRGSAEDLDGLDVPAFDAVAVWNCFDQLPDPGPTLARIRERLRPGGLVAIRVPNGGFFAAWSRRPGGAWFLALNNLLGFPYLHGFTPDSLTRLLEESGFDIREVRGDTLVPLADGWTRPWAGWEERLGKRAMKVLLRGDRAPWFEVYAVRR